MRRVIIFSILIPFFTAFFSQDGIASDKESSTFGKIVGKVKGKDGKYISGIIVEALGPVRRTSRTNSKGTFELKNLPPGLYNLTFKKKGLKPEILKIQVKKRETSTLNAVLQSIEKKTKYQLIKSKIKLLISQSIIRTTIHGQHYLHIKVKNLTPDNLQNMKLNLQEKKESGSWYLVDSADYQTLTLPPHSSAEFLKHWWRDPEATKVKLTFKLGNTVLATVGPKDLPEISAQINYLHFTGSGPFPSQSGNYDWHLSVQNNSSIHLGNVVIIATKRVNGEWISAGPEKQGGTMKPNSTTVYVNEYNTKDADQCRVDIFIRKDTSSPYVLLCNTLVNFTPTDAATLYNISIINSPPILTEGCESHYRADVINNSNQMISAQDIELWCYQYIPLSDKWVPVGWRSIDGFLPNQTKSVDLLFFGRDLRANKLKSNLKINGQKVSESSPQIISPVPISLQIKNVQVTRQSGIVNW